MNIVVVSTITISQEACTLTQCCFNVGPPSSTSAQHETTLGQYLCYIYYVLNERVKKYHLNKISSKKFTCIFLYLKPEFTLPISALNE